MLFFPYHYHYVRYSGYGKWFAYLQSRQWKLYIFFKYCFFLIIWVFWVWLWQIELPPWTDIVKTGVLKELAPYDPDWYYIRAGKHCLLSFAFLIFMQWIKYYNVLSKMCLSFSIEASMARKIYLRGGLGVGAFRRIYGGSKRNGSRPRHFGKSSGSVARHILQQLEQVKIVEIDPRGWVTSRSSLITLLDANVRTFHFTPCVYY